MASVLIKNKTNKPVQIPERTRLGFIQELEYENCFYITDPAILLLKQKS